MTAQQSPSASPGGSIDENGSRVDRLGRIPFRVRIAVVGHRLLDDNERLAEAVREQVRAIADGLLGVKGTASTPLELAVVSSLAEGADRIVVREVLAEAQSRHGRARLEVILPDDQDAYASDQGFTGQVLEEFHRLLAQASSVTELTGSQSRSDARFKLAGQAVVDRCDVLLALWSGDPSGGEGGSSETLLYAAARWRPCIWISTDEGTPVRHNLDDRAAGRFLNQVRPRVGIDHDRVEIGEAREPEPASVLGPLIETHGWVSRFNDESLPEDFGARCEEELASPGIDVSWVAAPYLRATLAANRYQRLFNWATWAMAALATLIAATIAFSIAFSVVSKVVLAWVEVGLIVTLFALFLYTHSHLRLHKRWLSCRFLGERLRSAKYVGAAGGSLLPVAGLRSAFVEQQTVDWVQRAFEEVWDSRPQTETAHGVSTVQPDIVRSWLVDDWISPQIEYHRQAAAMHRRRDRWLGGLVTAMFAVTLAVVLARAVREIVGGAHEELNDVLVFLAIVVPAAAASVGAVITVRQHQALAERYHRMQAKLEEVKGRVLDADEDSLQKEASEAARVIAEESGDWFGAMWFMDIEHPP